jgi:uncharacterized protein (UPF0248 family)
MSENPLRDLLNRLRWDRGFDTFTVVLTVISRQDGVERDEQLPFSAVTVIGAAGVTVADGTFLPYHRITEIRRGSDVLWLARPEESR